MTEMQSSNRAFILVSAFLGLALVAAVGMMLFWVVRHNRLSSQPAASEGLTRHTFALAGNDFEALMPPEYTLTVDDDAQVSFTLPGQRADRAMILSAAAPAMRFAEGDLSVRLAGGYRLRYVVAPDLGAGSGGTVARMVGQMQVGSMLLTVECRDQDELEPAPQWCIPYLHHLKVVKVQGN